MLCGLIRVYEGERKIEGEGDGNGERNVEKGVYG